MPRVLREDVFDAVPLAPAKRLDNGFVMCEGRISRTGIQLYYDHMGRERRELRLPEEVFDEVAIASFRLVPLTNTHPPKLVESKDAKMYSVGTVGENVRKLDEKWLGATLMLTDADAISAAEAGRSQLSCGYTCEVDEVGGEWQGQKYDAIQRKIRGNHVALVDAARAGPDARARLDERGNAVLASSLSEPQRENKLMPHKFRIDGMEIEVTDANAQVIVERCIADAKKAGLVIAEQVQAKLDESEKKRAESEKALAGLQAKHDTMAGELKAHADKMGECDECDGTGKVDGAKCDNCGGTGKVKMDAAPEARKASRDRMVQRAVTKRVALEVEARTHLGTDAKLDGVSDLDVKKKVILQLAPEAKLDGKNGDYILARYDAEIERAGKGSTASAARAAAAVVVENKDAALPSDPEKARDAMLGRLKAVK